MRALVVDDESTSRVLLQTFLSQYGDCQAVTSGSEAIAAFRQALEANQRFDLICMDIVMPGINGDEAVLEIRTVEREKGVAQSERARIVMISVLKDPNAIHTAVMLDCDGYLLKPINTGELLAHLGAFGLVPLGWCLPKAVHRGSPGTRNR